MKHVVTAARHRRRVLVTGFGPFPGAPINPTLEMLHLLEADGVAGIDLAFAPLPVTFAGVAPALREAARCRPDALLLLGLATRRRMLSVETLARNVVGHATADTDGTVPGGAALIDGGPPTRAATWPADAVLAALREAGHAASLSTDAGDYVCNAALYHALGDGLATCIGFLHVPPTCGAASPEGPTVETLADAARIAIDALSINPSERPAVGPRAPGTTR